MSELLIIRDTNNFKITAPMKREEYYNEQIKISEKGLKPEKSVDIVVAFIFNEHGELFLQKRSKDKFHNPSLIDKTMGGHVQFGDSPEYTVMVETVQELQVPSITVRDPAEFKKTLSALEKYLTTIAIIRPLDKKFYNFPRLIKKREVEIANYVHLYIGIYSGRVKTVDREARGILQYSIDDLEEELKTYPNQFTKDLHILFKDYKDEIVEFLSEVIKQ